MIESFKDFAELQAFAQAQSKSIIELSRRVKERDEEIIHLKKLLEGSVPLIKEKNSNNVTTLASNDQEYICRTEINKLRDISIERELTLEEVKKFDIFCKTLKDLSNQPKTIEIQARTFSNEELLAIISDEK